MTWQDAEISKTPDGDPMCKGMLELCNDRRERLGTMMWFYDEGPFYAHAVDLREPELIRRIGPCTTMEGAKRSVEQAVEGALDMSKRAAYKR